MSDRNGGDGVNGVAPSQPELERERRRVELRLAELGIDLGDPALWREPAGAAAHGAVPSSEASEEPGPLEPMWWRWLAVAAAVVVIAAALVLVRTDRPDWTVTMGPTDSFPNATATVDGWNEGGETRMVLDISGLDPAPDGYFYEMWMSRGPIHVSAGTFAATEGIELRAAVSRLDYPRLWVTLEPIDEDESPTTTVVVDTGN